jgi:Leu/Phe-tRNA-protein transferase
MATTTTRATLTTFDCCAMIEGFDGEEHTEDEILEAFQHLIDTGAAWTLQGWYGRTAASLIEQGLCRPATTH